MDANDFLFWTALMISGSVAVRAALARNRNVVPWIVIPCVVLATGFVANWLWPETSGFLLGAQTRATRFVGQRRYVAARRAAKIASFLHPSRAFRDFPRLIDVLER